MTYNLEGCRSIQLSYGRIHTNVYDHDFHNGSGNDNNVDNSMDMYKVDNIHKDRFPREHVYNPLLVR